MIMHKRLLGFLNLNKTLFEHQYGFQPKKTTAMAILDVYTKIIDSMEKKN